MQKVTMTNLYDTALGDIQFKLPFIRPICMTQHLDIFSLSYHLSDQYA